MVLWYVIGSYKCKGDRHCSMKEATQSGYEAKDEMVEVDLDEAPFCVCDAEDCLNSATPYKAPGGNRYCLTHAQK